MAKTILFLKSGFGNGVGDVVRVVQEDDKRLYFYDGLHRYCYVFRDDEGVEWRWISHEEVRAIYAKEQS